MARVVETDEPVVVQESNAVPQHVHDARPASSTGLIIAIILLIIVLLAIFWWRPWGGSSTGGGGANIHVTTPSPTTTK